MPNSLYNQLQGGSANESMVQKFNEFAKNFQGDPEQMVKQLIQSGRMSQALYNQLRQMALQFRNILRR